MTALLTQHGTQRHARGTGKTQLWGKPPASPISGSRHPGPPVQVASQPGATAEGLRVAEKALFQPSCQRSRMKRGVNPLAEGHRGAEPSPPHSGLQRDVKVTTDGPRTSSQLCTSILEAGRAETHGMLQPPAHPQWISTGDIWPGGAEGLPRSCSALSTGAFQKSSLRRGKRKHKSTQALPCPVTHASRGSKAAWPWYDAVVGSPHRSPGRSMASRG